MVDHEWGALLLILLLCVPLLLAVLDLSMIRKDRSEYPR